MTNYFWIGCHFENLGTKLLLEKKLISHPVVEGDAVANILSSYASDDFN